MQEALVPELTKLGLPGLVIAALGWALWRAKLQLDAVQNARLAEAEKCAEERQALQELRITEAKATTAQLLQVVNSTNETIDDLKEIARAFSGKAQP